MPVLALNEVNSVFKENGYHFDDQQQIFRISKRTWNGRFLTFFSFLIGLTLLTFGLYIGFHFTTIISGFFFIGVPLLFQRWRMPDTLIIDRTRGQFSLKYGLAHERVLELSSIKSLEVDESVLSSDVSPFKDGYQDFVYRFKVKTDKKSYKVLELAFRKESSETMKILFDFMKSKLNLS